MIDGVKILIGTLVLLMVPGCGAGQRTANASSPYLNKAWAENKLWDDGQAEVAIYDAVRLVYGKPRAFEYTYILVKEDFNQAFRVKTDDYNRDDLYPVMKINKFCEIPTQAYPYHYLTSVFIKRDNPSRVHKLTNTSQEWCGNTAKSFLDQGNYFQFDYMSYWDGEGNGSAKIKSDAWFEEQLSYSLRTLQFEPGLAFDISLFPQQINSRAILPEAMPARVEVKKAEPESLVEISGAVTDNAWEVAVKKENGDTFTFWIGATYPNYLLKMTTSNGQELRLKEVSRSAYWAVE